MYSFHIIYTLDYYNNEEVMYDFNGTIEELEYEISTLPFREVSNIFVHCGNGNKQLAHEINSKIKKYNAYASC